LRALLAFGFFVASNADDEFGVVQREIVDALVEALAVCVRPESANGCQNFLPPAFVTA
jgi:hypothetical protein